MYYYRLGVARPFLMLKALFLTLHENNPPSIGVSTK
jgi:hypothetical protein